MTVVELDLDAVLDSLDQMSSQRPVAAQIVATSNNENCGASQLAAILGADITLAAKVMKLANSAYFGLSGRVRSLQFAVAVVGFNTVRSVATVALSGTDEAQTVPDGFWKTSVHLAAACGALGPQFDERTADAMCLGLLAQLGAALLHQADPDGYVELTSRADFGMRRFEEEARRYGICSTQLTAEALQQWSFPTEMVDALREVRSGDQGALLRTAYELTARSLDARHRRTPLERLSQGKVTDAQASGKLAAIKDDVETLRSAMGL